MTTFPCPECGQQNDLESAYCSSCGVAFYVNAPDAGSRKRGSKPRRTSQSESPDHAHPPTRTNPTPLLDSWVNMVVAVALAAYGLALIVDPLGVGTMPPLDAIMRGLFGRISYMDDHLITAVVCWIIAVGAWRGIRTASQSN